MALSKITNKKKQKKKRIEDAEFKKLYHTIPVNGKIKAGSAKKIQPSRNWKFFAKRALLVLGILLLLAGVWVGWKIVRNGIKIFGWGGFASVLSEHKLKGEDRDQVNILLAGNSADDPNHAGAQLTDSIMIISVKPKEKIGYILSVPRDLYVNIPDNGFAKINETYQDGERDKFSEKGYAPGGMGLLEKVLNQNFGFKADYYALVNYQALRQAVDAVGGITVNINSSDPRGLFDPSVDLNNNYKPLVKLPNGPVNLNGVMALGLARARGDSYGSYGFEQSDFTRTEHQRQILLALKDKGTSLSTLANPVKLGQLLDSLGGNVKTDFSAGELRRMYSLSKNIPSGNIKSVSLNSANGKNLLTSYRTRSGQSALIPSAGIDDYSEIQAFLSSLLQPPPQPNSNPTSR